MSDHQANELLRRAVLAFNAGRTGEAEQLCRNALSHRPEHFETLYLAGILAGQRSAAAEAADLFRKAAKMRPQVADVHFNLGVALGEQANDDAAIESYARALQLEPRHADACFNQAVCFTKLGRHAEAVERYDYVIGLRPSAVEAHHNRAIALVQLGRFEEALAGFQAAIALRPDHAAAHRNKGSALAVLRRWQEALASYEQAAAIDPASVETQVLSANALIEVGRPDEALLRIERAAAREPRLAEAAYIKGNALRELGRYAEAVASYEHAIALEPRHASAHWNLADVLLLLGDFERGWRHYARRFEEDPARQAPRRFEGRTWQGDRPVAGKTVLLYSELGFGDTLQFCRYAIPLVKSGARVVIEAQAPVAGLLRTLPVDVTVIAEGESLPAFDYACPLTALPFAFKSPPAEIPAVPYLHADSQRIAKWEQRLGRAERPRVAIVWRGSRGLRNDERSMPLAEMLAFVDRERFDWIALQKDAEETERAQLAEAGVRDVGVQLDDFEDTAAVLALVDLVISVDTSVAHVAGATGRTLWLLLSGKLHDWRWMLEGDRTPWYPNARLFRKLRSDPWTRLVEGVRQELGRPSS